MFQLSKPKAYLLLLVSILLEIIGSSALVACDSFHKLSFTLIVIASYSLSFFLFSKILHIINLAVAYATWTSVGTVISSFIGVFIFHQYLTLIGWLAICGLCFGVVLLNLYGMPQEKSEQQEDK